MRRANKPLGEPKEPVVPGLEIGNNDNGPDIEEVDFQKFDADNNFDSNRAMMMLNFNPYDSAKFNLKDIAG